MERSGAGEGHEDASKERGEVRRATVPEAILVGGANGAGKTTFARRFLRAPASRVVFLNADEIQHENARFAHSFAAVRELLRRLVAFELRRESFAVETTLSSRMYLGRLRKWKTAGYSVTRHFIELPSADYAVRRVARRAAAGGHDVPERDVRRRFRRDLEHFQQVDSKEVNHWLHWYSDDEGVSLVERRETLA